MDQAIFKVFCEAISYLCTSEQDPDCKPNQLGSQFFIGTEYTAVVTPCGVERVIENVEKYGGVSKDYWRVQRGLNKAGMLKYWTETKNFEEDTYENRNNVYRVKFIIPPYQDKAELSVIFVRNKYMRWDYYGPIPIFKGSCEFLIGEPFEFMISPGKAEINKKEIDSKGEKTPEEWVPIPILKKKPKYGD